MDVICFSGMDQAAFIEQQAERYSLMLEALEECIEAGISLKSIRTLVVEMGVDMADVGHICNKLIMNGH